MTDRNDRGTPETPSTDAARHTPTHPAAEGGALRKLGSERDDTGKMNISGHDASGRTDRSSIAGAAQDAFWRKSFADRSYTDQERGYDHYRPAFQYGWESRDRYPDRPFEDVEAELRREWDPDRTGLAWDEARPAVRDAFERPSPEDASERPATEWSDPGNPLA